MTGALSVLTSLIAALCLGTPAGLVLYAGHTRRRAERRDVVRSAEQAAYYRAEGERMAALRTLQHMRPVDRLGNPQPARWLAELPGTAAFGAELGRRLRLGERLVAHGAYARDQPAGITSFALAWWFETDDPLLMRAGSDRAYRHAVAELRRRDLYVAGDEVRAYRYRLLFHPDDPNRAVLEAGAGRDVVATPSRMVPNGFVYVVSASLPPIAEADVIDFLDIAPSDRPWELSRASSWWRMPMVRPRPLTRLNITSA